LEEGAHVYFCSRTQEHITATWSNLATKYSTSHFAGTAGDVSSPKEISSWVSEVIKKEGRLDVIVSNVSSMSVTDTPEAWSTAYNTDIQGTVSLIQAALPHLEASKGNIITISSVSGRDIDSTAPSPYGAFKAALIHYTAQLAHTLAPKGIRANTVSPGNIYIEDGVWGGIEKGNLEFFKSQMGKNVMGRFIPFLVSMAHLFLDVEV
jgi:3-oxoacyl-[acyl-carrier protein] reductase